MYLDLKFLLCMKGKNYSYLHLPQEINAANKAISNKPLALSNKAQRHGAIAAVRTVEAANLYYSAGSANLMFPVLKVMIGL
jgi:hypothetical protein